MVLLFIPQSAASAAAFQRRHCFVQFKQQIVHLTRECDWLLLLGDHYIPFSLSWPLSDKAEAIS